MALTVRTITTEAELAALEPAWTELFARAGTGLPFQTYEWISGWWKHLREDRAGVRDSLQMRALYHGDVLVAVAPLLLTERPRSGPMRVRFLQFVGADPNMTEVRGLLAAPGYESAAVRELAQALRRDGGWDWVRWSGLREPHAGAALRHLDRELAHIPDFLLPLGPTWDEFRGKLGRNIKESLRKCYNSLKRDGKEPSLQVARTPAEIGLALDRFLALHSARADADVAVRHNDVFASAPCRLFLRDTCERLARRDIARVFELVVDGKVVATRIAFEFPGSLYLYYSGYDPEYGKYSVMTTCVAEAIKYAISRGLPVVNLSTGRDVSKTRWDPVEVVYEEGIELADGARAKLAYGAMERAYAAREDPRFRVFLHRLFARRAS